MKKTILIVCMVTLLAITSVNAIAINYKERCDIIRPATEYRPEKVFYGIGIYGRTVERIGNTYYEGLTCFAPSLTKHKKVVVSENNNLPPPPPPPPPVCEPTTQTICNNVEVCNPFTEQTCKQVEVCKEECHKQKVWKETCEWKHGKKHCNYGWVWQDVRKDVCITKTVCEDVINPNCKIIQQCHEEQTGCD